MSNNNSDLEFAGSCTILHFKKMQMSANLHFVVVTEFLFFPHCNKYENTISIIHNVVSDFNPSVFHFIFNFK